MNEERSSSVAYQESIRLLLLLQQLTLLGQEESQEADRIRDSMEQPWNSMSDEERRRVRELSAELMFVDNGQPPLVDDAEIERRFADFETGSAVARPWSEVKERAKRQ